MTKSNLLKTITNVLMMTFLWATHLQAQASFPDNTQVSETALFQRQWPRVDEQSRAYFRIKAPNACEVFVDCCGRTSMSKEQDGYWYATTHPLPVGFHFYDFTVDGTRVTDTNTFTYAVLTSWNGKK